MLKLFFRVLNPSLSSGQCEMQTADRRLGAKCRLRAKYRLKTTDQGKMLTHFFS